MNKKQLQLVAFEQAKRLKELEFDWECDSFYWGGGEDNLCYRDAYDNHNSDKQISADCYREIDGDSTVCSAPTVALALKWIRTKKDICCGINPKRVFDLVRYCWWYSIEGNITATSDTKQYEAAESELLTKILEIL